LSLLSEFSGQQTTGPVFKISFIDQIVPAKELASLERGHRAAHKSTNSAFFRESDDRPRTPQATEL
jgi:hypothetical protein